MEETESAIGFGVQKGLLDTVAAWLPEWARVRLLGDRFYGTPALIGHCQPLGWDCRLRLKGNLRLRIDGADTGPVGRLVQDTPYLTGVELTARRVRTNVGCIQEPGHEEPSEIAKRFARDRRTQGFAGHRHIRGCGLPYYARLRPALGHRADGFRLQDTRLRP